MAVQLFKLKIVVDSDITTDLYPDVNQYFYELDLGDVDEGTLTIPAASFVDDTGAAPDALEVVSTNNGYYRLFINGVLQQSALYTVDNQGANVTIIDADTIEEDAPITLIVTNFVPVSTADNTVIT